MNPLNFAKQHKLATIFIIFAISLVLITISSRMKNQIQGQIETAVASVSLIPVSDYRQPKTVNIDNGTVQSMGQANLKSQLSAAIATVNVKLGDAVNAGQTLVQLQNGDISAQLDQAQARLDELKKGARPQDIQLSLTSADQAKTALINSIKDSYAKSDDAIHNHIDKFFTNPRQNSAEFLIVANTAAGQATFQAFDPDLANTAGKQKYEMEKILADWQSAANGLNENSDTANIESALALSKNNLQKEIDFMNLMAPLVNNLSSDSSTYKQIIDGYKAEFSAARSTVSGAASSLQGSETGWKSATLALNLKLAGASAEQIRQAQASVDALLATLAKTRITSPISGKISYLAGRVGELATPGLLIASVVNPGALQIEAYASENDLPLIAQGDQVNIDGNAKGIVTGVSPAIDPLTKKAEISVAVTQNSQPPVVIGQNVSINIISKQLGQSNDTYLLPIQAIQFSGNGNYVLSADKDQKIVKTAVTTGEIVGENVYVTGGLGADTKILPSVRGFKEGDTVKIQE